MKILAVGDIVGENGLKKLREILPNLKQKENIDFVIVNGENVAGGMGITERNYRDILSCGTDVVTMGNHTWAKKDIFNFIDDERLIRPANYTKGVPGKGHVILKSKDKNIAVINLIGRVDVNVLSENPFKVVNTLVEELKDKTDLIVVDFHAEATAEKIALGHYLDGKVTAVFGTHTHVQTADGKILPKGTAYITDIGMTGPEHSVIGMEISASIKRLETTLPEKYKLAEGNCMFNGVIFEINDETNKVTDLKTIQC